MCKNNCKLNLSWNRGMPYFCLRITSLKKIDLYYQSFISTLNDYVNIYLLHFSCNSIWIEFSDKMRIKVSNLIQLRKINKNNHLYLLNQ